jgi:hypothetical protein
MGANGFLIGAGQPFAMSHRHYSHMLSVYRAPASLRSRAHRVAGGCPCPDPGPRDPTPGTAYSVSVAAVPGAGTGPAATATGTTPAG